MHFRVSCIVDDLADKMCDDPNTYDRVFSNFAFNNAEAKNSTSC
jgi:hypothetical protein